MIPKIIHYCWFGGNEKSDLIKDCMKSWKKYCPDWQIIEWNESNFDINLCPYTKEAYAEKKWAFVADVARLYAVSTMGGIYLDTDVELKKSPEELLQYKGFFAFESPLYINTGKGFGAEKDCPLVQGMLQDYFNRSFKNTDNKRLLLCTQINTQYIRDHVENFRCDNSFQVIEGIAYLPFERIDTYLKHYNSLSWADAEKIKKRKHGKLVSGFLSRMRASEKITWVEKHFGKKGKKIYIFTVYDLFDTNPGYFAGRLFRKLKRK